MAADSCNDAERIASELYVVEQIALGETPECMAIRAYSNLDAAKRFIKIHFDDDKAQYSDRIWWESYSRYTRYVVRLFPLDHQRYPARSTHAWEFSIDGRLLREEPEVMPSTDRPSAHFELGDLVEIVCRLEEFDSPHYDREFGVVAGVAHAEMDESTPTQYQVYAIHQFGHLIEFEVPSHFLRPFSKELPAELLFLRIFSEHLKGIHPLPESVTRFIRPGDRSIRISNDNVRIFDFDACRVQMPDGAQESPEKV